MAFSDLNPTEEEFGQLFSHFQGVWSPVKRTWEIVDSYVEQTKEVWETNAKRARRTSYKSPRAANIIRHFVNSQAAYAPRVHREPLGRGAAQRSEADELEEGLIAALIGVGRKNPLLPWKSVYRYLAQYDYSVTRLGADIVHWDDIEPGKKDFSDDREFDLRHRQWERSRLHHNPLTLDVPHPTRVLMDPNEKNPPFAIHTHTMEAHKVRELVISREGRAYRSKVCAYLAAAGLSPFDPVIQAAVVDLAKELNEDEVAARHQRYLTILRRGGED